MSLPPFPEGKGDEAAAARLDAYILSPKFHGRVRALTLALLGVTAVACVTADWDAYYGGGGKRTVFSDVRPALRRALDRMYGVKEEEGAVEEGQKQQQQQRGRR
jgi:hypothetical protein